jgi:hypothetical protein
MAGLSGILRRLSWTCLPKLDSFWAKKMHFWKPNARRKLKLDFALLAKPTRKPKASSNSLKAFIRQ